MQNYSNDKLLERPLEQVVIPENILAYEDVFKLYDLEYRQSDYYLQVGTTNEIQGWILHISIIAIQLADALNEIIPFLIKEDTPFKIPKDKSTARHILDGDLGLDKLGKVISIYPKNSVSASNLAKTLIQITNSYSGPKILTDAFLGGTVYTRYGGINPILQTGKNGQIEKYIRNSAGSLVKDNCPIPFNLPDNIIWPFGKEINHITCEENKNIKHIYRPLSILKSDPRGNVFKGIYLKGLFNVQKCVIKVGKQWMITDDWGRDVRARLLWQKQLHDILAPNIKLPKILDCFEENNDRFLVMEFINGESLQDRLTEINLGYKCWFQLTVSERSRILEWLIQICYAIDLFHKNGFAHRDIAPGNFMIDKKGKIVLIDIELAYNLKNASDKRPFEYGTPGFMSPQQIKMSTPTEKDDVFSLGALMINFFTALSPTRFDSRKPDLFFKNISYFVHHSGIEQLITSCMNTNPTNRPNLDAIISYITNFRMDLLTNVSPLLSPYNSSDLKNNIIKSLWGLNKKPFPIDNGIWMSKTLKNPEHTFGLQKDYSPYAGIHTGIAGTLYLLARAKRMGYSIDETMVEVNKNWEYLNTQYFQNSSKLIPGLYSGSAGLALMITECIRSSLVINAKSLILKIYSFLELKNDQISLANGISGHGLALLQCTDLLEKAKYEKILTQFIDILLSTQQKNGSWNTTNPNGKSRQMGLSLAHGLPGLLIFLLEFARTNESKKVSNAIRKALTYLMKRTDDLKHLFHKTRFQKCLADFGEYGDERTGTILCFVKAYDLFQEPIYKQMVESAFLNYPELVVNTNFSADTGLAALGELYLDAGIAFKSLKWHERASHIASAFLHTAQEGPTGSMYWTMEENSKPTTDLIIGNGGIIHFLIRCAHPNKLGHILIN